MTTRKVHGPAVRAIRELLGLRASDVADLLGIDRGHYSRIEAGAAGLGVEKVGALASRLGVGIDQITYPVERVRP